jgi:regulator of ribonuclease activity B
MNWFLSLLFLVGAGILWRIYSDVRKAKEKRVKDWDESLIERLRKSGSDPFQPHDVDFFMAMPSEAAGQAVAAILQGEGYKVDVHAAPDNPADTPFSLHATKSLRLSVPGMQELTVHFKELAKTHGGHYDGWSAAVVPQGPLRL